MNTKAYINKLLKDRMLVDLRFIMYQYDCGTRFYHTWDHVCNLLAKLNELTDSRTQDETDDITLAILFHDIIYVPGSKLNEIMSADLFSGCVKDPKREGMLERNSAIHNAIVRTDYAAFRWYNRDSHPLIDQFLQRVDLDSIFFGEPSQIKIDTWNVYKEFKHLEPNFNNFKKANLEFMEKYIFKGRENWNSEATFERHAKIVNSITEW